MPANVASVLYNKTEGGVLALDVNTLGVLDVVTGDASIQAFEDLAGRTVYITGKGISPEYVMNYLLERAGITDQVTLEFKSEPTEVVSGPACRSVCCGHPARALQDGRDCQEQGQLASPINLTDVWDAHAGERVAPAHGRHRGAR